jgi:hypothetical protein
MLTLMVLTFVFIVVVGLPLRWMSPIASDAIYCRFQEYMLYKESLLSLVVDRSGIVSLSLRHMLLISASVC